MAPCLSPLPQELTENLIFFFSFSLSTQTIHVGRYGHKGTYREEAIVLEQNLAQQKQEGDCV